MLMLITGIFLLCGIIFAIAGWGRAASVNHRNALICLFVALGGEFVVIAQGDVLTKLIGIPIGALTLAGLLVLFRQTD